MKVLTGALDANPIIGLAKGDVFDLLASLYTSLYVSPGVVEEVIVRGQGRSGAAELAQALGVWIIEVAPDPQQVSLLPATLSSTDREILALALDLSVDHLLTNDARLCQEARRYQVVCLQTPNVIVLMKDQGLVPEVRPILDRMRQRGFDIDNSSYEVALRAAGE